ncbi:hypothetical protein V2J09_012038 [Rumex salicifolius]
MASCDDDFSLLGDDDDHNNHHHHHNHLSNSHHHHQSFTHHGYLQKSGPIHPPQAAQAIAGIVPSGGSGSSPRKVRAGSADSEAVDYATGNGTFNPFSSDHDPTPFQDDSNPNRAGIDDSPNEKRKERDDYSDGGVSSSYKKPKSLSAGGLLLTGGGGSMGGSGGEYRKDREEWSDSAIECLLEAYTEKYTQLNRGNLRGRDWEEVAAIVSERCENQSKTVEQCKNKVDNLKKRYKLERHRMSSGGISSSHWPWFKRMETIVGNSVSGKVTSEDDKQLVLAGNVGRQPKRYIPTPASLVQMNSMKSRSLANPRWQRVVFKISGAALASVNPDNIDPKVAMLIAREVAVASRLGVQVAIVVGGRNFFCGNTWVNTTGADRSTTYQIGMMATLMNAILIQSALEKMSIQTRIQTAFALPEIGEVYNRQRAIRHLEKGRVVIFGGVGAGAGNPLFSTDTAAALRATEIHANAVLKGTNVDGVYDCNSSDGNITFEHISFRELGSRGATSMDMMSLTFCEENNIPVVVFNLLEPGNISRALCGEQVGTLIDQSGMLDPDLVIYNGEAAQMRYQRVSVSVTAESMQIYGLQIH